MRRIWLKLSQLSWRDRGLLIQAGAWSVIVRLCLDGMPFRLWRAWLLKTEAAKSDGYMRDRRSQTDRCAWAAVAVSRLIPRCDTCLVHAVVVHRLLHARGIDSTVRIGVARGAEQQFEAHAWVEADGHVVVGDDPHQTLDDRFQRLTDLASTSGRRE